MLSGTSTSGESTSAEDSSECIPGYEFCSCVQEAICLEGLVCESDRCVSPAPTSTGGDSVTTPTTIDSDGDSADATTTTTTTTNPEPTTESSLTGTGNGSSTSGGPLPPKTECDDEVGIFLIDPPEPLPFEGYPHSIAQSGNKYAVLQNMSTDHHDTRLQIVTISASTGHVLDHQELKVPLPKSNFTYDAQIERLDDRWIIAWALKSDANRDLFSIVLNDNGEQEHTYLVALVNTNASEAEAGLEISMARSATKVGVAWNDLVAPPNNEIRFSTFGTNGSIPATKISNTPGPSWFPSVASNGDGYLIAWPDVDPKTFSIHVVILGKGLVPVSQAILPEKATTISPRAAWNGAISSYVVTFPVDDKLLYALIDQEGEVLPTNTLIAGLDEPEIVTTLSVDNGFLLLYRENGFGDFGFTWLHPGVDGVAFSLKVPVRHATYNPSREELGLVWEGDETWYFSKALVCPPKY